MITRLKLMQTFEKMKNAAHELKSHWMVPLILFTKSSAKKAYKLILYFHHKFYGILGQTETRPLPVKL